MIASLYTLFRKLEFNYKLRVRDADYFKTYDGVDECNIPFEDKTLRFDTSSWFSKKWFYPRYADGALHEPIVSKAIIEKTRSLNKPNPVFFDIGSNLGYYSTLVGVVFPKASIHSFEMHEVYADLHAKSSRLNGIENISYHLAAVGDSNEPIKGPTLITPNSGLSINSKIAKYSAKLFKQVIIDDVVQAIGSAPDVVKIDVEGAEMGVLRGMKATLSNHSPLVFVEVHPKKLRDFGSSVEEACGFLKDLGYDLFEVEGHRKDDSSIEPLREDLSTMTRNSMLLAQKA